jgi:hypothetical protein
MTKNRLKRICEVCGASLEGKHKHARFCSNKCRVKAHRKTLKIVIPETLDTSAAAVEQSPHNNVLSTTSSYFVLSN